MKSPTIVHCLSELKRRWNQLSDNQKAQYQNKSKNNVYCICKKSYSWSDPTMVSCDFCQDWHHVSCLNLSNEFVKLIDFYHCEKCIRERYAGFLQYTYHLNNQLLSNTEVFQIGMEWNEKNVELRSLIQKHRYPVPETYETVLSNCTRVKSKRGFPNHFNNCWMNVVNHVVCGTFLFHLIERLFEDNTHCQLIKCLQAIHNYVTKARNIRERVSELQQEAIMLGVSVGLDPNKREHQDACDYYDSIIEQIFQYASRPLLKHYFQAQFLYLRTCQQCGRHESLIDNLNYLSVKVLKTKSIVSLQSLLWEKCTGQCATREESRECESVVAKEKQPQVIMT